MAAHLEKPIGQRYGAERGAIAAEYALLLALIAASIVAAVTGLLGAIIVPISEIATALN